MNQSKLNEKLKAHKLWLETRDADNVQGERADLRNADLRYADLLGADLRNADIDYSCIPMWCGSLSAHFDDRQLAQIAYHLVKAGLHSKNASAGTKLELKKLAEFANTFHRAEECGLIKLEEGKESGK